MEVHSIKKYSIVLFIFSGIDQVGTLKIEKLHFARVSADLQAVYPRNVGKYILPLLIFFINDWKLF